MTVQSLLNEYIDDSPVGEPSEGTGELAQGPARTGERRQADNRRDRIADEMWRQYQTELRRRNW